MTNSELVAFWNVTQFQRKLGSTHQAESAVSLELVERGIPHKLGKLTKRTSVDEHVETTIAKTVKGEFIRLKPTDTAPVWVRGHYDRATRTYSLSKADDMNHETFVKASRKCYVGFTY